jgi:hypothetical protein
MQLLASARRLEIILRLFVVLNFEINYEFHFQNQFTEFRLVKSRIILR